MEKADVNQVSTDTEPFPEVDGDHCIFYAVQSASMYFYRKPLTREQFERFDKKKSVTTSTGSRLIESDQLERPVILLSLRLLNSGLKENGIKISKITAAPDTNGWLKKDNMIKREKIKLTNTTESENAKIRFPILLMIQRSNDVSHVWFPKSKHEYHTEIDKHIGPDDRVVFLAKLKRIKE